MKKIKLLVALFFIGCMVTFAQQKKFITYKVVKGETIQSISKALSITPYDLLKLNPDVEDNVNTGDIIIIPNKEYNPEKDIENSDLSIIGDKDIIVDNFIYHEVLKKETIYSLLKKFEVSIDELNTLNPLLLNDGLKQGQILKIPVKITELQITEKSNLTQPYLVKSKETKFSIAKRYGITIAFLEELNPQIKEKGLQFDDVILVPKKLIDNAGVQTHKIEKKETLFGLSNKFGISQEELISANPQLEDGVIEGMLIQIPNIETEDQLDFIDGSVAGMDFNIAMMLPFLSKRDSLDFENDRLLNITTDFYFGALMALDSLKNQGLSVRLKVYDTENSEFVSKKISSRSEFDNFDAVIGPMFLKNVKVVSANLAQKNPFVLSLISTKDHSNIPNKNLVQETPTKESLAIKMLHYIKSTYSNQKLLIITDESTESSLYFRQIQKEINLLDTLNQIKIIKPIKGYIKPDIFRKNLEGEKESWVFLIGSDEAFIGDVLNNLGVLPIENNITLYSFEKNKSYDRISNSFLARVNFHYPTSEYLDRNSKLYLNFKSKFIKTYKSVPSQYAIKGFDITYDILMRLAQDKDLIYQGSSQRIASKFKFIENTSGGVINQGIFIVRYDDLALKVVE